jgi:hypothetical protein
MLMIVQFAPEKFGSRENSPCRTPIGFKSKSPLHGLDSNKNMFGYALLPLSHHHVQCDDGQSKREDMRPTSCLNQNFLMVVLSGLQKFGLDRVNRDMREIPKLCKDRFWFNFAGRQHGRSNIRGLRDIFGCSRDWEIWPKSVLP